MLNLDTMSIKVLEESYKSAYISSMVLHLVLAVIGVGIIIWLFKPVLEDSHAHVILFSMAFILISFALFANSQAPYYDIKVEVQPTKELTEEKLKNNDSFEEINNKIYFKTEIAKGFLISENGFNKKEELNKKVNKEFEDVVGKIWIEDRKTK